MNNFSPIEEALQAFKNGKLIVVVDDEHRENEGDIIFSAETATQEKINFCATHGKGLICIAIDNNTAKRIGISPIASNKKDAFQTAFYTPIDGAHEHGITTGISANERAITARLVTHEQAMPSDFITPGHLFPVVAKEQGVLLRPGHTEAAVDLCKLTQQKPAAIICEIMNKEGDMMRRKELFAFAKQHELPIITIQQVIQYRKQSENYIERISSTTLPTKQGLFEAIAFKNIITTQEHLVLYKNEHTNNKPIVRFHSECLTGDVFSSQKCDCQHQLHQALLQINDNGNGALIYLKGHEGRGIGLANKIAAYHLQEKGLNTYEANTELGLPEDARNYDDAIAILKKMNLNDFLFITNNPKKIEAVQKANFTFEQMSIKSEVTKANEKYLLTKKIMANHTIL
jgi:3,4-dihydroxy 2-butanone 4-phosphate synthase / GTP cyclohydrolase II